MFLVDIAHYKCEKCGKLLKLEKNMESHELICTKRTKNEDQIDLFEEKTA
jgi:hypothetical protein